MRQLPHRLKNLRLSGKVYKLAAIFPGVITDADYNTLAYVGVSELQKATGIETTYSESVAVPDVDRVMREYIDAGYNMIWTHGGQFVTQTVDLARLSRMLSLSLKVMMPLKIPPRMSGSLTATSKLVSMALVQLLQKPPKPVKLVISVVLPCHSLMPKSTPFNRQLQI